jgi:hypothetical protein
VTGDDLIKSRKKADGIRRLEPGILTAPGISVNGIDSRNQAAECINVGSLSSLSSLKIKSSVFQLRNIHRKFPDGINLRIITSQGVGEFIVLDPT